MINFNKYYSFFAEDVECIEAADSAAATDFPYRLTVHLKSGKFCTVNYADSKSRDSIQNELVRQIDYQKQRGNEEILSMLYIIKNAVEKADRRSLRIWRQLRDLLSVRVEDE